MLMRELEVLTQNLHEAFADASSIRSFFFFPQLGTKEGYLVKQGAIVKARDRSAFILCSKQNKIVHSLSLSFSRTGNKDGSRSTDTN